MASLAELAAAHTELSPADIAHLQRLVAQWGLPADLSFGDLLLFAAGQQYGERGLGIRRRLLTAQEQPHPDVVTALHDARVTGAPKAGECLGTADDQRIFSTQLCKLGLQRDCLHRVLATGLQLVNDNDLAVGCL